MNRSATLPAVLQEIADVAGIDAAWALARAKGGQEVFIPKTVPHRHWLPAIVGQEAAQKICAHFRSNHQMKVLIPMGSKLLAQQRWAELLESDLGRNEIAQVTGTHIRTVSRHRARKGRATARKQSQGDLF